MHSFDVVIVGAGAAGLFCAGVAGQLGLKVLVLDHSEKVAEKIRISGGGRCNFTNLGTSPANFLGENPRFCRSALAGYTPAQFVALMQKHQIPFHEKHKGQLFCDRSAEDIIQMLLAECAAGGVTRWQPCSVKNIRFSASSPHGTCASSYEIDSTNGTIQCAAVVVASGGLSIPSLGASGFGYELARRFGHGVLPTRAGLVPLTLSGSHQQRLADLSGVSLEVEARCNGRSFREALLFTHRGVSGPAILQISSYWQPGDELRLDLLPGRDAHDWLCAQRRQRPDAELKTVLAEVLPRRFAQRLCERWLPNRPMRQYDPPQLRQAAALLADWPLVASGTEGYRTAEVTLGGVDTDGVSSSTMQSRHVPGLYFIGEVLDVTGWLGGYNFQWAWASGHAAGEALLA